MSRPLRIQFPDAWYHVMNRGRWGGSVFRDKQDYAVAEGLIRRLPPFSRFLRSIALSNGEIVNFTKMANDCQVSPSTVTEYVGLLEDTLIGFILPAWTRSRKRKAIKTGKFYSLISVLPTRWPGRKPWTAIPIYTGKVLSSSLVWSCGHT